MHDLIHRLDPARALHEICDALGSSLTFDFAGIAALTETGDQFEVLGATKRTRDVDKPTGGIFPRLGTAANWSLMTGLPFVSEGVRNLNRFPQTRSDMERYGMASNAVIPLNTGAEHSSILYFLSRRNTGHWLEQVGLFARLRTVIEPTVTAFLAAKRLVDGAIPPGREALLTPEPCERGVSLACMERRFIERTLQEKNWVIEGERGAASQLGLKPSTLRSRMRKLGLRRASE